MERKLNLEEVIQNIDPSSLSYQEWVDVGMALKHEGYGPEVWDSWSQADGRYKENECFKKWESFQGTGTPVTGGTIVKMAKDQGWRPSWKSKSGPLDWDSTIQPLVIDRNWLEPREVEAPKDGWDPVQDLARYLRVIFQSTDHVGYVTNAFESDGRFMPGKGSYARTAGELLEALERYGNIEEAFGTVEEKVGAWIRFNPLDGKGVKNDNVTEYRFALVESDEQSLEKQNAIIRELELPVAALVHSGNKSIHAIVRIDAGDYQEYRKRVDYLYDVCQKNGLKIDLQNRNPSRLSRMPGVTRNGNKQFLIDTNIGKGSWNEWQEWIEGVDDDLPEPESLTDTWENLPPLAEPLIEGVLRQGHKMLIAGPSKAGKSFLLIGMCIDIAEGRDWLGWETTQGKVLYVNLELDRASCLHRFKDVYEAKGQAPNNLKNIDIWNLRGKAVPMDKLAPKLIRRAKDKGYAAIVIDPIYKVITGDENAADQMAHFTNQFDKLCTELGSSVIYCHHHSKGFQGEKRAMDRASGSGVFARDPDALLDLMELEVDDFIKEREEHVLRERVYRKIIEGKGDTLREGTDTRTMQSQVMKILGEEEYLGLEQSIIKEVDKLEYASAWRLEGTLREFASFKPKNFWFKYPIHQLDQDYILDDANPEGTKPGQVAAKKTTPESRKKKRVEELEMAFSKLEFKGETIKYLSLENELNLGRDALKKRIDEHGGFKKIEKHGEETIIVRK